MTFIASGELVYHIAAVGVVFDLEVFFFDLRLILTILAPSCCAGKHVRQLRHCFGPFLTQFSALCHPPTRCAMWRTGLRDVDRCMRSVVAPDSPLQANSQRFCKFTKTTPFTRNFHLELARVDPDRAALFFCPNVLYPPSTRARRLAHFHTDPLSEP